MLPKYVKRVRSKGRDYYYFDTGKRVDGKKVYARLPDIRDPSFGGSLAAMQGHRNRGGSKPALRVPAFIDLYRKSADYRALSATSRRLYDIYLDRLERLLPSAPVSEIRRSDMQRLFDGMAETPGAANAFRRTCSVLFAWGKSREYLALNPCDQIARLSMGEHQPWPDHILAAALGAKDDRVRLLSHLLYYTAQRIGDVTRMTWADVADGRVAVVQQKTARGLRIRIHDTLAIELARTPKRAALICVTATGRPMTPAFAGKLLSEFTADLGHRCVPHGLRKNAVTTLLEAGCSTGQVASVSGQSLQMVEHYAKARDQVALSDAAILQWQRTKP